MALDKLIYQRGESSKEPQIITFHINPDLDIKEFKRNCKRLAQSLGYSKNSIEEQFGRDEETGDPKQLKLLFD